ncbi:MAG: malonyl-CoA synthase [Rhizobiaceae bacterium]
MKNHLFDGLLKTPPRERQFAEIPGAKNAPARYYSYQDVHDVSGKFANLLVSWGVEAGDRVAVQIPKSIEAVMLYLACVRTGAVFLPLNTAYTANEVDYFLANAGASLFICDPEKRDGLVDVAKENNARLETMGVYTKPDVFAGSLLDEGLDLDTTFENIPREADDLAAILYTSGTTGRSKGAMLTHDNLLSNSQALAGLWQFTKDDVLLHALPIYHTHGLFVATNVAMLSGASLILLGGFNTDAVIEHLPKSTSLMGVPTFYTRLLDDERFNRDLVSHMRLFVSGSAPLLAETHIEFEERTGHRVLERYGMTETNMNTSNPFDGERRAGTVGFPLPGVSLRICDAVTGEEVGKQAIGIIEVKGPNVFPGYWKMPEKTAEEFRDDGFFITGDLGKIDADGYVQIVGREKDLIISGGFNIYPKEIELLLDDQDGILESAVIGVPHKDFGEGVVGVVVANSGASVDTEKLLAIIKPLIARFKQPKHIFVLNELPRNAMGKVQKNALREQFNNVFDCS